MLNARTKGEVRKIKFPPNARSAKINSFLLGKFLWLAGIIDFSSLKFKASSCFRIPALFAPASSLRIKEPILALNLASVTTSSLAAAFCSALASSPLKPATFMRSLVLVSCKILKFCIDYSCISALASSKRSFISSMPI